MTRPGLPLVLLCLLHGAVFATLRTRGEVRGRAARTARVLGPATAAVVAGFAVWTQVTADRGSPRGWSPPSRSPRRGSPPRAPAATVATVFVTLYPRVMVSSLGEANDLTIENTAAASYSLTVMTWVAAILLPVVLGYQWWTYHVFRQRLGPAATAGPGVHIPTQRGPGRRAAEQDDGRSAPAVAPHRPPPAPRS